MRFVEMAYVDKRKVLENVFKPDIFKFRIGELSQMTGVSTRQLRYWESKDIIQSLHRDGTQDARVYDYETFHKVQAIKYFLDEGYTLRACVQRTNEIFDLFKKTHAIIGNAVRGIEEINGETMVDLGVFDEEQQTRLWASIDDEKKVHYHVRLEGE